MWRQRWVRWWNRRLWPRSGRWRLRRAFRRGKGSRVFSRTFRGTGCRCGPTVGAPALVGRRRALMAACASVEPVPLCGAIQCGPARPNGALVGSAARAPNRPAPSWEITPGHQVAAMVSTAKDGEEERWILGTVIEFCANRKYIVEDVMEVRAPPAAPWKEPTPCLGCRRGGRGRATAAQSSGISCPR